MISKEIHEIFVEDSFLCNCEEVSCIEVDPLSVCLKTSTTHKQADTIHCIVFGVRHHIIQQLAKSIGISLGLVHTILT